MIEYIRGELADVTPTLAVVEAAGVGYALNISLNTFTAIQEKKEVKLFVHEAIVTGGRDDSFTLYGFATRQERELYRLLIKAVPEPRLRFGEWTGFSVSGDLAGRLLRVLERERVQGGVLALQDAEGGVTASAFGCARMPVGAGGGLFSLCLHLQIRHRGGGAAAGGGRQDRA